MLLHYLVKVKTLKMHVNTTSAFNANYQGLLDNSQIRQLVDWTSRGLDNSRIPTMWT